MHWILFSVELLVSIAVLGTFLFMLGGGFGVSNWQYRTRHASSRR